VTGPTGSGKSTTLYATLNILNEPHRNIITVEDPVEYRLAGINQVQVHPKAGLTFASALRSILRADPDVILVGEVRDRETAVIAIEAALTGHLVLTTLHTNNAASTPMRLVEMGVEPFLVTSAIDCVVAQRLARRLCDHCKEPYQPTEAELVEAGWSLEELSGNDWPVLQKPMGCSSCGKTGYRGRFAIHEVLLLSEEMERMIIERRSTEDLAKLAEMEGMITLKKDGLRKVALGHTSLEEIFRVVA
jgi:type IV pilus assembly protein PilB